MDSKWYRNRRDRIRIVSALINRDGLKCKLCFLPLKHDDITVDHIIPVSKGGSRRAIHNLQLAHFDCNQRKGNGEETSLKLGLKRPKRILQLAKLLEGKTNA